MYVKYLDYMSAAGRGWGSLCTAFGKPTTETWNWDTYPYFDLDQDCKLDIQTALQNHKYLHRYDTLSAMSFVLMKSAQSQLGNLSDLLVVGCTARGHSSSLQKLDRSSIGAHTSPATTQSGFLNLSLQALGSTQPGFSFSNTCVSFLLAIHHAYLGSVFSKKDILIFSVDDCIDENEVRLFQKMGVYHNGDRQKIAYSYHPERGGMVQGRAGGACILSESDQGSLGKIYGTGSSRDPDVTITGASPSSLENAILEAIESAGIDADDIGFIIGHGAGTKLGDQVELDVYDKLFPHAYLSCAKWLTGHCLSTSGLLSLGMAMEMLNSGAIPLLPYSIEHNNKLGTNWQSKKYKLIVAMGFNGQSVALVVGT